MQNIQNMQNMQNVQNLPNKPTKPNWTYQTKPTKPNLPNQTYQSEPTKLSLPNKTYQTKPTKPNLPKQTYLTKSNMLKQAKHSQPNQPTKPNQNYWLKQSTSGSVLPLAMFFYLNLILWHPKHILSHCEGGHKCIFQSLFCGVVKMRDQSLVNNDSEGSNSKRRNWGFTYFGPKNTNFSPFWPVFLEFFLGIVR